jgi:hypothetical protein
MMNREQGAYGGVIISVGMTVSGKTTTKKEKP